MRKRVNGIRVRVASCSGAGLQKCKSGINVVSKAVYALVDLGVKRFIGTLDECKALQAEMQQRHINLSIVKA